MSQVPSSPESASFGSAQQGIAASPMFDEPSAQTPLQPIRWKLNLVLFSMTVVSVFLAGALYRYPGINASNLPRFLPGGWTFAVPLLLTLLCHEFGHFIAARIHRVDASLPFFIPMPLVSPFGTMGAVISMRGRIRSRNALLDIGASGPLAGLCVAIPVLIIGLLNSEVGPVSRPSIQEGQSLLYVALKRIVLGPIPDGYDVLMSPTALAGWTGLFITVLNLIPFGQLDGGHIAYALFGTRQNTYSSWVHRALLLMFVGNLAYFSTFHGDLGFGQGLSNSATWLVWFILLRFLERAAGKEHPPTEPGELSPVRRVIGIFSLVLFVVLFMPTPWAVYG